MERLRGNEPGVTPENGRLRSRSTQLPRRSVRAVLSVLDSPRVLWNAPDEPMIAGAGQATAVVAAGADRFHRVRAGVTTVFERADSRDGPAAARPRVLGGLAFHDTDRPADPWSAFPSAAFILPAIQVTWADDGMWLTVSEYRTNPADTPLDRRLDAVANRLVELPEPTADPAGPGIASVDRRTELDEWRAQVNGAINRIRDGELRKVVLAQALDVALERPVSLPHVLERLAGEYPDCRRFLFEPTDDSAFFGATPERLVTVRGRTVETEALAGSTGRGDTDEEDEWLADELRRSDKDRHEHDLVTEAIVDQLHPVSTAIRTHDRSVRRLATVQHLETPIRATLASDLHVLDLVEALHPTPAVGGLPPEAAMETISGTERFDRGWYAAPVGWIDGDGNGSFAVGIRSAVTAGSQATLFAGAGIVADSEPDREWDEVQLKYRPILDALA